MSLCVSPHEGVCTVLLNRPEAHNALDVETLDELAETVNTLARDESTRIVVFRGGGKAFCAGADVAWLRDRTPQEAVDLARKGRAVFDGIRSLPQPTIAAVNGVALGGGCELAMACDMRIAATKAKFGLVEVKLGVIPGWGGTQVLPQWVGRAKAMELILSGRIIDGQEAADLGLVNVVVPLEDLWHEVDKLCASILRNGPSAVRSAKLAIDKACSADPRVGFELESSLFGLCFGPEQLEGMSAFLEKRDPEF